MENDASGRWWLVGALALLSLLAALLTKGAHERDWGRYVSLMRHGSQCQAVVVRAESGDPCRVDYSFSVAGKPYYGMGADCRVRQGQTVRVTYLGTDPSTSCLGSPGERLADEVVSYLFHGVTFAPLS